MDSKIKIALFSVLLLGLFVPSTATATAPPSGPTVIWDGTVNVTSGTFDFVPTNNVSASYSWYNLTDLGVLEAAADSGNLTLNISDAYYSSMSSFFLVGINGTVNEPWGPNSKSWSIFVNGNAVTSGLGANELCDGDVVTFWYCPTNATTYAPITSEATYVMNVTLNIPDPEVIWEGSVNVTSGTFDFVPTSNASASYSWFNLTDLGVLEFASDCGNLSLNISDAYYSSMSSFFLVGINGTVNEPWAPHSKSWSIFVNGNAVTSGLGANELCDGDVVTFWYCPSDPTTYAALTDEATYVMNVTLNIPDPEVIWEGTVNVTSGTFDFVPTSNASASYSWFNLTDLGVLEFASDCGNLSLNISDAYYSSMSSFFLVGINGTVNEPWAPHSKSWSIFVNGNAVTSGLGANELSDGDVVTFWYCPGDSSTYAALTDEATYVMNVTLNIPDPEVIWEGSVNITSGTFDFVPTSNASASYSWFNLTDLGVLEAASDCGNLSLNISDAYYSSMSSFFLVGINGTVNEPWAPHSKSWSIFVNGNAVTSGLGSNELSDGDVVTFWYCPGDSSTYAALTDEATYVMNVTLNIPDPEVIWEGSVNITSGTFDFVPTSNASASYSWFNLTDLGVLEAASDCGNLSLNISDAYYSSMSSFFLVGINGTVNEAWAPHSKSWSIFVNGNAVTSGLGSNELSDGDVVTFWYCPGDSSTYAALTDEATYVMNVTLNIPDPEVIWEGSVDLYSGSFNFIPTNNASANYALDNVTDICALSTAADAGNLSLNISDTYYSSMGSFFLVGINGTVNEAWAPHSKSWSIFVNGNSVTSGLGANELCDGDVVTFWYCPSDPATYAALTDEATYVVNISVNAPPEVINYTPQLDLVADHEDGSREFSVESDITSDIEWFLDGVSVKNTSSATTSTYLNNSANAGIFNVTVVCSNSLGSNLQTWTWKVVNTSENTSSIDVVLCVEDQNVTSGTNTFEFDDNETETPSSGVNSVVGISFNSSADIGPQSPVIEILNQVSEAVSGGDDPSGDHIYQRMNIYFDNDTISNDQNNISERKILFRIEKSWVETNSIDLSSITLNHYVAPDWVALSTVRKTTLDTVDFYFFEATTTGFSPFTISGDALSSPGSGGSTGSARVLTPSTVVSTEEEIEEVREDVTEQAGPEEKMPEQEDSGSNNNEDSTEPEPAEQAPSEDEQSSIPGFTFALAFAGLLAVKAVFFNRRL